MVILKFCGLIDKLNELVGRTVYWLVLVAVLVSSINAVSRYAINASSNAWLELQWYLFSAVFLLASGYTLLRNEHVRIDVFTSHLSARGRAWVDIIGTLLFLLPMAAIIFKLSIPIFVDSFVTGEESSDAGGLIRWPAKLLIPIGFALLILQAFSELVKRIAFLAGVIPDPAEKSGSHGQPSEGTAQ